MRRTTSKSRKTNNDEPDEQTNNSVSLQMELELLALKAKNTELTKAHAKLTRENSDMRHEILSLHGELVDIQTRHSILEAQMEKLVQDMSKCTPSLIDMLNLFLQVTESIKSNNPPTVRVYNRFSDKGSTPKSKAITHTVKPHTVNGTVLNLNPTISLTRLSPVNNQSANQEPSSSTSNIDYRNSLPSTSFNGNHTGVLQSANEPPELDHVFVANDGFVSRKRQANHTTSIPELSNPDFSSQMEIEDEDEPEEEDSIDSSPLRRLSTIHEESACSTSGQTRTSFGEIRIYLSRLSAEDMQTQRLLNDSRTSTEAIVNDTCLNIETTVIEDQEARVSKTLRADIMVFSPHTNSTRLSTSLLDNLSPRATSRDKNASGDQSSEVTPSSSSLNGRQGNQGDPSWLPTPSMSSMGDIDKSNFSRLDILTESDRKLSPTVPPSTLITKRSFRRKTKAGSEQQRDDGSPRSSRGSPDENSAVANFVNRQRGGSDSIIYTPTIVLERLANNSVEHRPTQSLAANDDSDPLKENEHIPNHEGARSKKSKTKNTLKSPKQAVKRKKTANSNDFQEKIREVQIRLSNYTPASSENTFGSFQNSSDNDCASTTILERLANGPVDNRPTSTLATNRDSDPPKENENIPNNESTRSKRSKTKSANRSPNRTVKRKKTGNSDDLQEKIREVQIRLSNYVPENPANPSKSPEKETARPSRAAKPKVLKECSLKGKLRRMF